MESRPSPQALEAEQALLGGLIVDPQRMDEVSHLVSADDFYRPDHARFFMMLRDMRADGDFIDLVTVSDRVMRGNAPDQYGGLSYVLALPDKVPSTANLAHYARIVRDKAVLRRVIRTSDELTGAAHDGTDNPGVLLDRASQLFASLAETHDRRDWSPVSTVVDEELVAIQERQSKSATVHGVTTGFRALDDKLGGLRPSQLLILAARPAMGKTALVLNIAQRAADQSNVTVGIFSLEMSRTELVSRMLCGLAMVEGDRVRKGRLDDEDWVRMDAAGEMLRATSLFIDDTPGATIDDIRTKARRLQARKGDLGLLVIDYLQLMQGNDPKASRQQQISDISRGLKILAKDLGVPVIALSQLNRDVEKREDKRPMISDLRESGAIEQDADVIMFIYRDEIYHPDSADKGVAEVIIAKQRSGPTGRVRLAFQPQYTRFDDLAEGDIAL